jgi:uncharacterized RDD family membrane protein YckC
MQVSIQHEHGSPYAGFWTRVMASVIDILGLFGVIAFLANESLIDAWETRDVETIVAAQVYFGCVGSLAILFYHMLFESSGLQATLGKLAMGIKVTDLAGEPVGMARAAIRAWPWWIYGVYGFASYFAGGIGGDLIINLLVLVSCIVVAFTAQKQGLHDMLAGALVVRRGARFMARDEYAAAF